MKESALSSELALHTAASIKSSSDPHLPEITEDEQDTNSEATQKVQEGVSKEPKFSPPSFDDAQTRHEKVAEILSAMRTQEIPSSDSQGLRPRTASDTNKALPPAPASLARDQSKPQSVFDYNSRPSISSIDGRMSSQSMRPSLRDLNNAYDHKPKIKLGPRPSVESVGRPETSIVDGFRPVSTLPAGLRMPARKAVAGRPKSQQKQTPFLAASLPPREPLPPPLRPMSSPDKMSFASSVELPTPAKTLDAKAARMTPEKRRLMKAVQLRQKQLTAKKPTEQLPIERTLQEPVDKTEGLGTEQPHESQQERFVTDVTPLYAAKNSPDINEALDSAQQDSTHQYPEMSPDSQDSPTSGPEPSDRPSTQASSLSEEEPPSQKPSHSSEETIKAEEKTKEMPTVTDESLPTTILQLHHQTQDKSERGLPEPAQIAQNTESMSAAAIDINETPLMTDIQYEHQWMKDEHTDREQDEHTEEPHTHFATQEKENPLGQMTQATESQPSIPVDQTYAPSERDSVDLVSTELQKAVIKDGDSESEKICGANQGLHEQSRNVTKHSPLSNLLAHREEVQPEEEQARAPEVLVSQQDHATESLAGHMEPAFDSDKSLPHSVPNLGSTTVIPEAPLSLANSIPRPTLPSSSVLNEKSATGSTTLDLGSDQLPASPENASTKLTAMQGPIVVPQSLDNEDVLNKSSTTEAIAGESTFEDLDEIVRQRKAKRHALISPGKRTSSPDQSDEPFLSDDSFLEELKTASLQEAKPISVSKSPIKPVFSRSVSEQKPTEKSRTLRSVSSPFGDQNKDGQGGSPPMLTTQSSTRAFSATNSPFLNPPPTLAPPPKKQIGVSTSISQRIKALEQLSSRPTSPTLQATPQSTFVSLRERKSSLRSPPGTSDGSNYNATPSRPGTGYRSTSTSPDLLKSDTVNRFAKARPESISVTATIIRDASNKSPERPLYPSEPRLTNLHQSPLVVEHQKMGPPPLSPLKPPRPQYARHASSRSGSSSSANELSPTSRRASVTSKRSVSSRNGSDLDLPRSASDKSLNSVSGLDGIKEERKDSKRSRLLKRMSSISSMSRRSIASALSPGPKEASIVEHQEPAAPTTVATTTDLGDVNIQFPDTLLWKRRHVLIDERGVLILSPLTSDKNTKVITRHFPLSTFRQPYLPDQDRQELANSTSMSRKFPSVPGDTDIDDRRHT